MSLQSNVSDRRLGPATRTVPRRPGRVTPTYTVAGLALGIGCALFVLAGAHVGERSPAAAILCAAFVLAGFGFVAGRRHDALARVAAAMKREIDDTAEKLRHAPKDIEARRRLESQLAHQAFHDPLTQLGNRALFTDRCANALTAAGNAKHTVAVLLLDLDDFKTVNDMHGYDAGDLVLAIVAARFSNVVRPTDTLARFAADEFALLLNGVTSDGEAVAVAQRLIDAMAVPIRLKDRQVRVGVSIGLAGGQADSNVETLMRDAGLAMHEAKARGKDCLRVFRPEMHVAFLERVKLGEDLQQALQHEQFYLVYQPIVDLTSHQMIGMEALVRWKHPARGIIPPLDFIKLAEDTGAIVPLGNWILNTACRQVAQWHKRRPTAAPLTITVNVSPLQLHHHSFVDDVRTAVAESRLDPACLVLEITESALVDDTPENLALFVELKSLGIRLAIDDFGTGYSSLSYLQRFPFDILKVDKSFVDGVAGGGTDVAFARTIIALGEMLNLRVLAEGIEQRNQLAMLKELSCGYGQGYLFAKPLDTTTMTALIDSSLTLVTQSHPAEPAPRTVSAA